MNQFSIAQRSKVDHVSLGLRQGYSRITFNKDKNELQSNWFPASVSVVSQQLQKDKTSNNSHVVAERANRIASVFDYTDKVGFKDGGVLQKLLRCDPPNHSNTTTIVANDNNTNNNKKNASSKKKSPSQYGNNRGLGTNGEINPVLPNNNNNNNNITNSSIKTTSSDTELGLQVGKRKHDAVEEPPLPLRGGYNTEPHQVAAPQQQDEQPPNNNNNTQQQQTKPSKKRRSRRKKAIEVDPEAERQEAELRAKIKASLHSQRVSRKDVEEEEAKKTSSILPSPLAVNVNNKYALQQYQRQEEVDMARLIPPLPPVVAALVITGTSDDLERLYPMKPTKPKSTVKTNLPRKKGARKKCGQCSEDKLHGSYTREQWKVAEDSERECRVCTNNALLEREKARISELKENHLLCCQFINSDGCCEGDVSKNCSGADDGWRPPRCSTFAHHLNGYPSFPPAGGSVKDDDSAGDDSLLYLSGGNDLAGGIDEYDPDDPGGVPPPPPPVIEQQAANLPQFQYPTFVQLSPGMHGAVNDATLLNGKTFVITGNFRVSPNTIAHNHDAITEMIESFGGQVLDYIPSCDYYLLRGDLMHIRSVVRCAARRERKIVCLFQLQHLLTGRRTLNDWDFQLPLSDHLRGSSGPNYTPPPGTVRRRNGERLCMHRDCPKFALSPLNEWNWYCCSHYYINSTTRRYELEVLIGFEERGLELIHNHPIKLNDKEMAYRPDFHRGSNRVEMIEMDGNYHLKKKYTKRDPIRVKRIFEWIRRNGKHAFLLRFYHGNRPKPSAALLDWLKSFFEQCTTGDSALNQDEIWLINYPLKGATVKNMLCTFGKDIVKLGKLYEHNGVCILEKIDNTSIYNAVMENFVDRPIMGFYSPSGDGNAEHAERHYIDSGERSAYLLAMTYGMKDMNGDPFPTYRGSEQLRRVGAYLKPLKSDLVHAIEWHRRRRRIESYYGEYDIEYDKCLEILGELTGRSNEAGSGEETFDVFDPAEVMYLKEKVDELLQRPQYSDLDTDGLQEVREERMRRPVISSHGSSQI